MSTKGVILHGARRVKWRLERFLAERNLNSQGNGVVNFIDVGAIGGLPDPWHKKENASKIRHLLRFEPQDSKSRNQNVTTVDAALWESEEERDFYISVGSSTGSSLFEQNYEYVRENFAELSKRGSSAAAATWFERSKLGRVVKVNCRTLDSVLAELNQPFPYHFLKVDTQGAEYQILKGAEGFLKTDCVGLYLELFTIPIMKGSTLLPDVVSYLDGLGFELVTKYPSEATFAACNDCFFLKRESNEITELLRGVYENG